MSAVQQGLEWWGAQLRDLLPARLREGSAWADLHADALIADVDGDTLAFVSRRARRETSIGPADPARLHARLHASLHALLARRPGRILLRVPAAAVLERPMTLPLAAEPELDRVVAYEIDRISPFTAAELAWTWAVEQRNPATGKLVLRIAMLPRATIQPALDSLREAGATPAAVLAPRASGGTWRIALTAAPAASTRRTALVAASVLCAVLAIAAAALPFFLQQAALDRQEARIERLRPSVAQADALRRRVADRASGLDAVAAETARVGQALDALATLTTLLPDDTVLTALSLRQRALTLSGRSASATRLIPLLAADPSIRNAAFAAPVTRAPALPGNGARDDVFSIRAEFGS